MVKKVKNAKDLGDAKSGKRGTYAKGTTSVSRGCPTGGMCRTVRIESILNASASVLPMSNAIWHAACVCRHITFACLRARTSQQGLL